MIYSKIIRKIFKKPYRECWSQCGEDMILDVIFSGVRNGFYVDVGANNPEVQSNTKYLYDKGWHGINIDANPNSIKALKKKRKRDINIHAAISDSVQELTFYMFKPSFYDTFDSSIAKQHEDKLVGTMKLTTTQLRSILSKYSINKFELLSIDVEGLDLQVLKSNDWDEHRPDVVLVEDLQICSRSRNHSDIYSFLESQGYIFFCSTPTNSFYLEKDFLASRFSMVRT